MKLNIKFDAEEKVPESPLLSSGEYRPEFTFREKDEPEFPDAGIMKIRFKKVRSAMDLNSAKPYSCTIEVREIISAEGEKDDRPSKKYDEAGPALDKLAAEKSKTSDY